MSLTLSRPLQRSLWSGLIALCFAVACNRPPSAPSAPAERQTATTERKDGGEITLAGDESATAGHPGRTAQEDVMSWPEDWKPLLGRSVTLEGQAADAKMGALLLGENGDTIWIDGLEQWPDEAAISGGRGKRVQVRGTIIQQADLPVFVQDPNEPIQAGMPVEPGTDVEQAAQRYLLQGAVWTWLE